MWNEGGERAAENVALALAAARARAPRRERKIIGWLVSVGRSVVVEQKEGGKAGEGEEREERV